jgi:hypothetical protein
MLDHEGGARARGWMGCLWWGGGCLVPGGRTSHERVKPSVQGLMR